MSKTFTKIGREIAIAVKQGGGDPAGNPRLRIAVQNAKGANMPKDKVEAAIKRAASKEEGSFQEVVYEGYGPHGVAIVVECATDNPTRSVSNMRLYFSRGGGALGTSGSLDFLFERKGVFKLPAEGINVEELELDLIDFGAEDINVEDGEIFIYTQFSDFGTMQKALEERGLNVVSAGLERIPSTTTELPPDAEEELMNLIERIEDDDDVQAVYHNIA
jgi:YebC/PmpR family DNA-binding regulatory protein